MTSIAGRFRASYISHHKRSNFCYFSLRNKAKAKAIMSTQYGDDVKHHYEDGSVLLERKIVRELQVFKG
jgi:hypothetical protein